MLIVSFGRLVFDFCWHLFFFASFVVLVMVVLFPCGIGRVVLMRLSLPIFIYIFSGCIMQIVYESVFTEFSLLLTLHVNHYTVVFYLGSLNASAATLFLVRIKLIKQRVCPGGCIF